MKNDKNHSFVVQDSTGRDIRVRIRVNPRSRRLILKVDEREREGILVVPRDSDRRAGISFAAERADWFSARLASMPEPIPFRPDAVIQLRGSSVTLCDQGSGRRTELVEAGTSLILRSPGAAATFSDRVSRFLKAEARRDLENSVAVHCDRLGVEARRVTIKDTRSRWGSCTSDGRLAFSWRLILAPVPVLDYVAAHECAHLIEMNHSERFWALVRRTYGDHAPARRWLKRNGAGLHAFGVAGVSETTSETASGRVPAASF